MNQENRSTLKSFSTVLTFFASFFVKKKRGTYAFVEKIPDRIWHDSEMKKIGSSAPRNDERYIPAVPTVLNFF